MWTGDDASNFESESFRVPRRFEVGRFELGVDNDLSCFWTIFMILVRWRFGTQQDNGGVPVSPKEILIPTPDFGELLPFAL